MGKSSMTTANCWAQWESHRDRMKHWSNLAKTRIWSFDIALMVELGEANDSGYCNQLKLQTGLFPRCATEWRAKPWTSLEKQRHNFQRSSKSSIFIGFSITVYINHPFGGSPILGTPLMESPSMSASATVSTRSAGVLKGPDAVC